VKSRCAILEPSLAATGTIIALGVFLGVMKPVPKEFGRFVMRAITP